MLIRGSDYASISTIRGSDYAHVAGSDYAWISACIHMFLWISRGPHEAKESRGGLIMRTGVG